MIRGPAEVNQDMWEPVLNYLRNHDVIEFHSQILCELLEIYGSNACRTEKLQILKEQYTLHKSHDSKKAVLKKIKNMKSNRFIASDTDSD